MLLGLVVAVGCDGAGSTPPANSVSGTVKVNGRLLNYGTVEFHGPDKQVRKSIVQTDGTYSIRNPVLGDVRVVVRAGTLPIGAAGGGGKPTLKLEKIDIPDKYSDPEKSEWRYTVTPGQHTHEIDLKP